MNEPAQNHPIIFCDNTDLDYPALLAFIPVVRS